MKRKVIRLKAPVSSIIPDSFCLAVILGFAVFMAYVSYGSSEEPDWLLAVIVVAFAVLFASRIMLKLRRHIDIDSDRLLVRSIFSETEIPLDAIAVARMRRSDSDRDISLAELFSYVGLGDVALDMGFGHLVLVMKDGDEEWFSGFTPYMARMINEAAGVVGRASGKATS